MNQNEFYPCAPVVAVGLFLATASLWMGWFLTGALTQAPFASSMTWLMAWFPALLGVGYAGFVSMLPSAPGRAARVLIVLLTLGSFVLGWVSHDGPFPRSIPVLQALTLLLMVFDTVRPAPVKPCPEPSRPRFVGVPVVAWFVACLGLGVLGLEVILTLSGRLPASEMPVVGRLVAAVACAGVPLWLGRGPFSLRPSAMIELVGGTMMVSMLLAGVDPLFAYVATPCAWLLLLGFARYAIGGPRFSRDTFRLGG